jgi:hypothetical protein
MQFSTIVLALAASASAAVLRRSTMGEWDVQITLGPEPDNLYLTAQYKSDSYPGDDYLRSACVENPHAAQSPVVHGCDRAAFDFSYDGQSKFCSSKLFDSSQLMCVDINVTQTVDLPNKMTVFGSAYFPSSEFETLADGRKKGRGNVKVTSAIA